MASLPSRLSDGLSMLRTGLAGASVLAAAATVLLGTALLPGKYAPRAQGATCVAHAAAPIDTDGDADARSASTVSAAMVPAVWVDGAACGSSAAGPVQAVDSILGQPAGGMDAALSTQSYWDMIYSTFREGALIALALGAIGSLALVRLSALRVRRLAVFIDKAERACGGGAKVVAERLACVRWQNPAMKRPVGVFAPASYRNKPAVAGLRPAVQTAAAQQAGTSRASRGNGRGRGDAPGATAVRAPAAPHISNMSSVASGSRDGSHNDANRFGRVRVLKRFVKDHEFMQRFAWQALHDPLTGLPNRAEFERHVDAALADEQRGSIALLFLDLDRFRIINDTCGYAAGDAMLATIAARLVARAAPGDIVARLGGDEFCVLLAARDEAAANGAAEHLRASIDGFVFVWEGQPFSVTVSVGVALIDATGRARRVEEAVRLAGIACDVAKERGRNRVQRADPLDRELAHHVSDVSWCTRVRHALEYDDFCLYVQPIVDTAGHIDAGPQRASRAELLLRMGSLGEHGDVASPGRFIRAAERYGLVTDIDRWVVRTALDRLARTTQRRFSEYAINLSGMSIGDERFLDYVCEQFVRTGVSPELICFEITETAAIANLPDALHFMNELKAIGCRFALDDFGAGVASLSYLKQLPVEYLKIDGSFVANIASDTASLDIVASINDIGHAMNCKTVAEYVDSEVTLQKLTALGVDYAQGYYIGRPMPWCESVRP
ncbi:MULTISPECIES: putative bifunctional diguanylate cyclase/phosphodiesterase [Burkholderia]|uniref:putative bifunctional diguanylate cyclase/phosphodiesterase n=1 Tax=Burkholderia TaxID=32008 RepID=UPI00084151A8|nr:MULTISPECIES: EAL domain-containing protein [unclassified Burkholderia]AOK30609.1 diguanylate phosphodiesterase [Burkholderia sp. Bp7605]